MRPVYWLFPLTAVGIAVFIVIFMIKINPSAPSIEGEEGGQETDAFSFPTGEKGWMDHFAMSEKKGYFYPVNEVTIELDTNGIGKADQIYRLTVPLKDSYEFFCLKQELQNSELPYYFKKEGGAMTLLVDSNDQTKLVNLVTKLKTYQITATMSPYKED